MHGRLQTALADTSNADTETHAAPVYAPGVSILICTYNRRDLLAKMVESIKPQLPAPCPLEVILIDNNSSDGTAEYAKSVAAADPAFVYVLETRQGLSWARNAGAQAARYGFILYLDDDATLPPHYIATLAASLAAHDPDMFGGPYVPDYADPKPDWFPEALEIRRKAETSGFYNHITLSGANFGMRKSVYERIGGFHPEYGMSGNKVGMLEERLAVETYRRLTPAAEQKIYYCVETFINHHTPAKRMQLGFQLKRIYIGNFQYIRYCLSRGVRTPRILRSVLWDRLVVELKRFIKNAPSMWRERKENPDRPMMELVRVTYRAADLHAALHFMFSDGGRTAKRLRSRPIEQRPLKLLVLTLLDIEEMRAGGRAIDKAQVQAIEQLHAHADIALQSTHGKSKDQIRAIVDGANFRAIDAILTDHDRTAAALRVMRGNYPHIQILYWARDLGVFDDVKNLKLLWGLRKHIWLALMRTREAARAADEVIISSPRGRHWLVRWLTGVRVCRKDKKPERLWRAVVEDALRWAPSRLSP